MKMSDIMRFIENSNEKMAVWLFNKTGWIMLTTMTLCFYIGFYLGIKSNEPKTVDRIHIGCPIITAYNENDFPAGAVEKYGWKIIGEGKVSISQFYKGILIPADKIEIEDLGIFEVANFMGKINNYGREVKDVIDVYISDDKAKKSFITKRRRVWLIVNNKGGN